MVLVPVYQRSCSAVLAEYLPRGRRLLHVDAKIGAAQQVDNVNAQVTSVWVQMLANQVRGTKPLCDLLRRCPA